MIPREAKYRGMCEDEKSERDTVDTILFIVLEQFAVFMQF